MSLRQVIIDEEKTLLKIFQHYIYRMGLSTQLTAEELLNEVTVEALSHEERFEADRDPVAWLIGIGTNLIRRRQTSFAKKEKREPLVRDLYSTYEHELSDSELFDRVQQLASPDPAYAIDAEMAANEMLSYLAPDDRKIIQLAILNEMDSASIAKQLGITRSAARVRLYRALNRLRTVFAEHIQYE